MVFSSFPVYLDHPNLHQFQQQAHHDHHQGTGIDSSQLPPQPPPQSVGGAGGSIRPGSMVDRARIAKLPLPEAGLKCPRCDSTNTKFCYFNNYSLTQPRHFCKTCRRYWTRGGALRNVPVGGGCRRNKKNKSSSSKSSTSNSDRQIGNNSTTTASPSSCSTDMVAHFPQPSSQLPLMAALQNLNHYGAAGGPMGSSIGGFQAQMAAAANGNGLAHMGFNLGPGNGNDLSTGGPDQWRLPSMGGFDATTNLFPFHSDQGSVEASSSMIGDHHQLGSMATSSGISQMASVKSEDNQAGLNLTKQFFVNSDSNQFWGTASPWTGFSGINSSSTSHLL